MHSTLWFSSFPLFCFAFKNPSNTREKYFFFSRVVRDFLRAGNPCTTPQFMWLLLIIYNGNWTEWSAIWTEIIHVISKSNDRAVLVRFEIRSMISVQNWTRRGSITSLLHPFWNRPNTGLDQFKYFIDAVLSRSEIKFMSIFWGEKVRVKKKRCKICHMILLVFHFPAIWSVTLNKP